LPMDSAKAARIASTVLGSSPGTDGVRSKAMWRMKLVRPSACSSCVRTVPECPLNTRRRQGSMVRRLRPVRDSTHKVQSPLSRRHRRPSARDDTDPVRAEQSIRRTRPRVVLVDAADSDVSNSEVLGRATMRGISVVMFGTSAALRRAHGLANGHRIETLAMPVDGPKLRDILERAMEKAG
jgi:hypothetical protein